MRSTWIYVLSGLIVLASCESESSSDDGQKPEADDEALENLDDYPQLPLTDDDVELPILPPIILLDFTNGTNSTADEKSKRTVNGNLGYGYNSNNLFSGKYNYYFPAGKTGTTVSIEESISPFLPKTIVESIKPGKRFESVFGAPLQSNFFTNTATAQALRAQQQLGTNLGFVNPSPASAPVFGQRTKLQKTTATNLDSFQRFATTSKPIYEESYSTPKPVYDAYSTPKPIFESFPTSKPIFESHPGPSKPAFESFSTPKPRFQSYSTPRPVYDGFSTPAPPTFDTSKSQSFSSVYSSVNPSFRSKQIYEPLYSTPRPSFRQSNQGSQVTSAPLSYQGFSTTARPSAAAYYSKSYLPSSLNTDIYNTRRPAFYDVPSTSAPTVAPSSAYQSAYSSAALRSGPKYSTENGVKYEHKIVWKYPDGKVSDVPPPSYEEPSYSDYPQSALTKGAQQGSADQQNPNSFGSFRNSQESDLDSTVYSQSHTQFSSDASVNYPSRQNQFASSALVGKLQYDDSRFSQGSTSQGALSSSSSYRMAENGPGAVKQIYEDPRAVSKYEVDSPNAEYTDSSNSQLYTDGGKLSPAILSKYKPQVQSYLTKVFSSSNSPKQNYNANSQSYPNLDYSHLLNYNPSISQYIRDPSSILKAQPTFVQAGNSLIPVIILRVDGAAPIEPKSAPNINLKALLQQYLTQYAKSVNDLARPMTFEKGFGDPAKEHDSNNPLFDLTQLTESLSQYSQNPSFSKNFAQSFARNVAQNAPTFDSDRYTSQTNYNRYKRPDVDKSSDFVNKYSSQTYRPQKVKSVQIIEDPRFSSYKRKN